MLQHRRKERNTRQAEPYIRYFDILIKDMSRIINCINECRSILRPPSPTLTKSLFTKIEIKSSVQC